MGCGASQTVGPQASVSPPLAKEADNHISENKKNPVSVNERIQIENETLKPDEEEEVEEDFSDFDQKEDFDLWVQQLKEMDDYTNYMATTVIESLSEVMDPSNRETSIKQTKYLLKLNIQELFLKIWKNLSGYTLSVKDSSGNSDNIKEIRAAYNYDCIKIVLWNSADCLPALCREIGKAGIIEILLGQLKMPEHAPSKMTGDEEYSAINADRMVRSNMGILHNVIRNCLDNRPHFREANALDILTGYLNCKHVTIQAVSVLILAYIIKDEEVEKISTGDECIQFILKILESALSVEDEQQYHLSQEYFFDTTEIVDGLIYLAANDTNKVKFVKHGALPLLVQLLKPTCTTTEQRLAATAIWTLAFHKDNKVRIRKEEGCIEALKRLQSSDDKSLSKACNGALWELREDDKVNTVTATNLTGGLTQGSSGHVMISYQWGCQRLTVKIKDRLKAAGYNVWMDVEQMGGSTLEAMAGAVERAGVVLICMSEKYKDSPSCRSEAEYTYKLHKEFIPLRVQSGYSPDGWLGILIGTKLYFDFSDPNNLETMMPNLIRELGDRGKVHRTDAVAMPEQSEKVQTVGAQKTSRDDTSAESWTNTDVTNWLVKNNLGHLKGRFSGYTGEDLQGLKTVLVKAPDFFYTSAATSKGLKNLLDVVKLEKALGELD
ncbi:uncharacterized protein LOC144439064 isoform X2 [Glandiceps talaboti]